MFVTVNQNNLMAGLEKSFHGHIFNKSKEEVNLNDDKYKGKVIGLYFSAHWFVLFICLFHRIFFFFYLKRCPPCRRFTPILIDFYNKHAEEKEFEIIFISSDRDEESFEEYYKDMPWLTLDFKERDIKQKLSDQIGIDGIPTLTLFDGDSGNMICKDAREYIQDEDKDGTNFPWKSNNKEHSHQCILI